MIGLGLSGSLLLLSFLGDHGVMFYALISFHNDDPRAVAGGIKALIITQVGGMGLLVGTLLLYTYQGNYQINEFLVKAHLSGGSPGCDGFWLPAAAAAKVPKCPSIPGCRTRWKRPPGDGAHPCGNDGNAGVYLLARFYPAFESVPAGAWR